MVEAGWEIASHGYRWIDHHGMPEDEEREHIRKAVELTTAVAGTRPLGHFLGRRSENTVRLVAEEGGFLYSQDSYADELPYWVTESGRPLLMIPYTADVNDHRFTTTPGFNWGTPFFEYLRDTFDALYAEGERSPRLMNDRLALPARRPGRSHRRPRALRRPRAGPRPRLAPLGASTSRITGGSGFPRPHDSAPSQDYDRALSAAKLRGAASSVTPVSSGYERSLRPCPACSSPPGP